MPRLYERVSSAMQVAAAYQPLLLVSYFWQTHRARVVPPSLMIFLKVGGKAAAALYATPG